MVDLVVNTSFDYASSALFDVTRVKFTGIGAVATFDASQFDGIKIHDDLVVRGVVNFGSNGMVINGGGVDASGWTFNFWDRNADSLTFNGTAGADVYHGSRMKDTISGGQGSDTFNTSDGEGDAFYGEGGKDYFRYKSVASPITDIIDGGSNGGDRLSAGGPGMFDFTGALIVSVEELKFGNADQTVILDYDQIYPFLTGSINKIIGSSAANTLEIHGTNSSFSNITVSNWTDGVDLFRIVGTSGQDLLFGSVYADEIVSGGGSDIISAGNGNDIVEIGADVTGASIDGEGGTDTLLDTMQDADLDLRGIAVSGFERLVYAGAHEWQTIKLDEQFFVDNSLTEIVGDEYSRILSITGNSIDLNGITFTNWDSYDDIVILNGGGNDQFDTSSLTTRDAAVTFGGLADVRLGGAFDQIHVHDQFLAGSYLDGGTTDSYGDEINIYADVPNVLDLSIVTLVSLEILQFYTGYAGTAILSGDQMGGATGIQEVAFDGTAVTLNVVGSNVDLSTVGMFQFDAADAIIIDGTDGDDTLIGSAETDIFNGGLGRDNIYVSGSDVANGDGASDTFVVAGGFSGTVNGGSGSLDTVVAYEGFSFFELATFTNVEVLMVAATSGFNWLRGDQIGGTGFGTVEVTAGANVEIFVTGPSVDLSGITLVNFGTASLQHFKLIGTDSADIATGSALDDMFIGSLGADSLDGAGGIDTVDYRDSNAGITVKLNTNTALGGFAEGDVLTDIENIWGSRQDDSLTGNSGDNAILGDDGDDTIIGGNGTDEMGGGDGNDTFGFSGTSQSGLGALSDIIVDFSQSVDDDDLIQLSAIDAQESTVGIDDAFDYIGQDAFTAEGQIRSFQSGTRTIIQINTIGTDTAEMRIILENFTATNLTAADFIL